MATPAAVLSILVTANTGGASASLTRLDRQLKGTAGTAAASSSRVASAAKYMGLGLAAVGVVSTKMAIDFDRSMRNVNSIAQLNEGQFDKLSDSVLNLAGKTAQAPQTLSEGLYDLVSSGFDAKDSIKVLEQSARAATAGLTDTATSTKAVAAVLNAYRLPANKAKSVADALFRTVDRGVISFDELSTTIGDTLPFASSLGVDLQEVGAATATMTKQGLSGAETMTRIKNVMQTLIKPGEGLTQAFEELGMSGEELIKKEGLQGALETLVGTTDGTKEAVAALFPNIRALGGVLALTGDNAKAAGEDLAGMRDSAGAMEKATKEQAKSISFQWNRIKADASAMAIKIGQDVLPVLSKMMDTISNPKLASEDKFGRIGKIITRAVGDALPDVLEAGKDIGIAILKGIAKAFTESDLLGKLLIGAGVIRLFGGKGVLMGAGTRAGGAMAGPWGLAIAAGIASAIAGYEWAKVNTEGIKDAFGAIGMGPEELGAAQLAPMFDLTYSKANKLDKFMEAHPGLGAPEALDAMNRAAHKSGNVTDGWVEKSSRDLDRLNTAYGHSANMNERSMDRIVRETDTAGGKVSGSTAKMATNVMGNVASMVTGSLTGIGHLTSETSKALKAFGVDPMKYTPKALAKGATKTITGGILGKNRGGSIPGTGNRDTIPALLTPGEHVINARDAARTRPLLEAINAGRYAKGGAAGGLNFALGPYTIPPIQYAADHAGGNSHVHITGTTTPWVVAIGRKLQQMGFMVGEHPAFGGVGGGHSATGGHYDALAIDVNSAANETRAEVSSIARLLGGAGGAALASLKKVVLGGPKGPLREMGQAAIDKVYKAANAFISKQSPTGIASSGSGGAGIFDNAGLAKLWTSVNKGLWDSRTAAAIAMGESSGDPRAIGHDPGGSTGYGLWQITSPQNADLIKKYGGVGAMLSPIPNAKAAGDIFRRQGADAWYAPPRFGAGGMPTLDRGGRVTRAGLASVHPGDVHTGAPQVEVHLHGSMDAVLDEVDVLIDGRKAEIADYTIREGGRSRSRAAQLRGARA